MGAGVGLCLLLAAATLAADAPATPFYYPTGTALEPQIATLIVGVNGSIGQAVVSGDRKHVTLNMDASLMGNAGIRGFSYQRGGLRFVGSAPATPPAARNSLTPATAATPSEISPDVSPLDKPGMVLIAPLER